jgi:hypothetical protein
MVKCELCLDSYTVCPGCTGGKIDQDLFMSCGLEIRCPICIGYDEAFEDAEIFKKYYNIQDTKDIKTMEKMEEILDKHLEKIEKSVKTRKNLKTHLDQC